LAFSLKERGFDYEQLLIAWDDLPALGLHEPELSVFLKKVVLEGQVHD